MSPGPGSGSRDCIAVSICLYMCIVHPICHNLLVMPVHTKYTCYQCWGCNLPRLACRVFCFTGCPVSLQQALHAQDSCNECGCCSGHAFFSGLCGPVMGSALQALYLKAACLRVPGYSAVLPNSITRQNPNVCDAFAVHLATIVAICNNMCVCVLGRV